MASKQILNASKIDRILHRMAHEIWETNFNAKKFYLVGISPKGPVLAKMISEKLVQINCTIPSELVDAVVDKVSLDTKKIGLPEMESREGDVIIVVDDVLYTGATMMHTIIPFVKMGFATVQVAVLVFRDYLKFPIRPNFVGIALASTTQQHVEVKLAENNSEAHLN